MMKYLPFRMQGALAVALALAVGAPGLAVGVDDFQLLKAVPADAAIAVAGRQHEGQAFLKAQYERVWKAVEAQNFQKDLRTLLKGLNQESGGDPEQFETQWQQLSDLLAGIDWPTLAEREGAFAMRMGFPTPEFLVLGRSSPEQARQNFAGFQALVNALVAMAPPESQLVVATQGEGDVVVQTISLGPALPGGAVLAHIKDVLLFGFGQTMPEQALALLRGEPGQALIGTERFQAALKRLPPPRDSVMFMDAKRFLGQLRSTVDKALGMANPTGQEVDPQVQALPGKLFEAIDLFDYIAAVASTEGMQTKTESITVLTDDARQRPLYQVLFGNGPRQEPLKFIPADAQGFTVWSGLDVKALYETVIRFVRENVPNGEQLIADFRKSQEEAEFQIEEDLLSWIGGAWTSFSTAGKSAYSQGNWVLMISVTDEAQAGEFLTEFFTRLEPKLKDSGGALREAAVEGAEGFQTLVVPWLAMFGGLQPTVGVSRGQLVIGSNAAVISQALQTAAGQAPGFRENARFKAECLAVPSEVYSASYSDLTSLGETLSQVLAVVPLVGMMMPDINQSPVGRMLVSVARKASLVVRELNFFQSSCGISTFDGQVLVSRSVTNYREPPPPPPPPTTEETDSTPAEKPAPAEEPTPE